MPIEKNKLISESLKKIEDCEKALEKITKTCCMPVRSTKMQATFEDLKAVSKSLKEESESSLNACLQNIEQCGGQLGKLYATCCTERKAPLYQEIFNNLNQVNKSIFMALGHSH